MLSLLAVAPLVIAIGLLAFTIVNFERLRGPRIKSSPIVESREALGSAQIEEIKAFVRQHPAMTNAALAVTSVVAGVAFARAAKHDEESSHPMLIGSILAAASVNVSRDAQLWAEGTAKPTEPDTAPNT